MILRDIEVLATEVNLKEQFQTMAVCFDAIQMQDERMENAYGEIVSFCEELKRRIAFGSRHRGGLGSKHHQIFGEFISLLLDITYGLYEMKKSNKPMLAASYIHIYRARPLYMILMNTEYDVKFAEIVRYMKEYNRLDKSGDKP